VDGSLDLNFVDNSRRTLQLQQHFRNSLICSFSCIQTTRFINVVAWR